jgi:hypothetical protein
MCRWIWTQFLNRAQNNNHKVKKFKELGSNPQLENLKKNLVWKPRSEVLLKRKNQPTLIIAFNFQVEIQFENLNGCRGGSNTRPTLVLLLLFFFCHHLVPLHLRFWFNSYVEQASTLLHDPCGYTSAGENLVTKFE